MAFFGNIVDKVGTALNLPEFGISETLSGGKKTTNTGRIDYHPGAKTVDVPGGGTANSGNYNDWLSAMKQVGSSGGGSSSGNTGGNSQDTVSKNTGGNTSAQDYYVGGGGGGSVAASNLASAAQLAEYDQGINQINHGLGRLDSQLNVALGNIGKQYNQRANELTSSLNRGRSQYNTQTTENQQDRRTNVNNIDSRSSSGLRSLLAQLGSMGAVGTDMSLAGRAVQDDASQLRSGAGQTFAKNQRGLDTNWNNLQGDIEDERKKVADWRSSQQDSARSQSKQTRQGLLTQLAQLRAQKAAAQGLNGADAARADLNRANALSREIDNLARINPSYTGRQVSYTPQTLDSYAVGGGAQVSAAEPASQLGADPTLSIYNPQFQDEDDDRFNY